MEEKTMLMVAVLLVLAALLVVVAMFFSNKKQTSRAYQTSDLEEMSKKRTRKKKKPLEFSKIIMLIVFATYFVGFLVGVSVVWEHPEELGTLLTYIGAPTAMSVGFYSWKAKAENCLKMTKHAPEGTTVQDLSNID
ncbi:MAG: hypothetical protein R3Y63_09305 [Eubacteriales bacterium]